MYLITGCFAFAVAGTFVFENDLNRYPWCLNEGSQSIADSGAAGVCVITGGGSGIGKATVKKLLNFGMTVIVGGRNKDLQSLKDVKHKGDGNLLCLPLDLGSLESVKKFASLFEDLHVPLHLLINNGGVMFSTEGCTQDGFELHWGVNYLSHVLLTQLLLPCMYKAEEFRHLYRWQGASHIVSLSSSTHALASPSSVISQQTPYSHSQFYYYPEEGYFNSKLACIYYILELQARLHAEARQRGCAAVVRASCLHPGVVNTNLYKHVFWDKYVRFLKRILLMSPDTAADHVLRVALSLPNVNVLNQEGHVSDVYYNTSRVVTLPSDAVFHAIVLYENTKLLLRPYAELL